MAKAEGGSRYVPAKEESTVLIYVDSTSTILALCRTHVYWTAWSPEGLPLGT